MKYNANWARWITISAVKHFEIGNYFVEGFERNTDGLSDWVEFRIDGPYLKEMTKGCWKVQIEINLLIISNMGQNAYRLQELIGCASARFIDCLDIKRYGEGSEDDLTLLGCMQLQTTGREKIIVTNFGRVRPDVNQLQASVEGHYEMYLD